MHLSITMIFQMTEKVSRNLSTNSLKDKRGRFYTIHTTPLPTIPVQWPVFQCITQNLWLMVSIIIPILVFVFLNFWCHYCSKYPLRHAIKHWIHLQSWGSFRNSNHSFYKCLTGFFYWRLPLSKFYIICCDHKQ